MATVFLASHVDVPNLKTVLKKLTDPKLADRFRREADKLALLDGYSGICQIKHFFEHDGDFYIVMEYIDGPTLDELVKADPPPDLERVLQITRAILTTLEYAHRQGIVHRDIKPTNIMIDRVGQVKIIDFGVAKGEADTDLTQVGTSLGSPRYMAPEQFSPKGALDWVRCDIYAVGVTLYYLLARSLPFRGANIYEMCQAKQQDDLPPPSHFNALIPPEVDAVVARAMARDPGDRFATAAEMRAALVGLENQSPEPDSDRLNKTQVMVEETPPPVDSTRPAPPPPMAPQAKGHRRLVLGGAGVALALILGTIGIWSLNRGDGLPPAEPLPLDAPALLAPAMGATLEDAPVEFRWDAEGDSLAVFTLQYGPNPEFTPAAPRHQIQGDHFRPATPPGVGEFFWRVRRGQSDETGNPWSAVHSFTLAAKTPRQGDSGRGADRTPPKTTPAKPPSVTETTYNLRIVLRIDGVPMMGDALLRVDGKERSFYYPGTLGLIAGEHNISAVFMYDGSEWAATRTFTVTAASERILILDLTKSN